MKVLYVGRDFNLIDNGGSIVAKRNYDSLLRLGMTVDSLLIPPPSTTRKIWNFLLRQSYGLTSAIRRRFEILLEDKYDFVFFDGSLYGSLLKYCHKKSMKTICFYHNVEQIYYREKYKISKGLVDRLTIPYIIHNELISTTYATAIIVLNERDSRALDEIYDRKSDFVFPTSFEPIKLSIADYNVSEEYLLFVGSNFFANVEATDFILRYIAPFVNCKIKIVGNVCENYIGKHIPPNVLFTGQVEDLLPYYANALAVIAPIFSGSGLKTKTVEALRYGKTIIGTHEAFQGIDFGDDIGFLCNTSAEFIEVINTTQFEKRNEDSLKLFERNYSNAAQIERLKGFLDSF